MLCIGGIKYMETRKFIKINKLFGKYDDEIDLSNRGIIFIGENGVRENYNNENFAKFNEF